MANKCSMGHRWAYVMSATTPSLEVERICMTCKKTEVHKWIANTSEEM